MIKEFNKGKKMNMDRLGKTLGKTLGYGSINKDEVEITLDIPRSFGKEPWKRDKFIKESLEDLVDEIVLVNNWSIDKLELTLNNKERARFMEEIMELWKPAD